MDPRATYHIRLKLCQASEPSTPGEFATSIDIQGKTVATDVDIAATAGGPGRAADLVFNDIRPAHGVISVRFWHRSSGQAMVQALEIGTGQSEPGVQPVEFRFPPAAGGAGAGSPSVSPSSGSWWATVVT